METYNALHITTLSTVKCVKYLLENGFQYVLTKKFSSDLIESLFSSLRQMNASNDQTTAVNVIHNFKKILVTDIFTASDYANVDSNKSVPSTSSKEFLARSILEDPVIESNMRKLEEDLGCPIASMRATSVSYVAGYLIRAAEENLDCDDCKSLLLAQSTSSSSLSLIRNLDRGALFYPRISFVNLLLCLDDILKIILPK